MATKSKPWADQPFQLLATPEPQDGLSPSALHVATEMSLAHNLLMRNLNALYLQAPFVKTPADIADFLVFCKTWGDVLHEHHQYEEEYFFPALEKSYGIKGLMAVNVTQHDAFGPPIDKFMNYVTAASTLEQYDGMKIRALVDGFGEILRVHLNDEIPTLLALNKYGGEKLKEAWDMLEKRIQKDMMKSNLSRVVPFGLGGNDRTYEGGKHKNWPPFPWFVPYICKYIFMRKHKGTWRFSPCTVFGQPRELEFAQWEAKK